MSHIPFTLLAYFFNSLSVLANKFLLNKSIPDPLVYVFYISLLSLLALLFLPFTFFPSPWVLLLASLSTIFWTLGTYLMFKALKLGQVSRVIPIIGTLIPLILLIFSYQTISQTQIWAVLLLVLGLIFLTVSDWQGKLKKAELGFEFLSAVSFAFAYILLRQAYLQFDFLSVLVWSRLILIPLIALILVFPNLRRKVMPTFLPSTFNQKIATLISFARNDGTLIFIGGQLAGVLSEFLILFSVSLANPALVNSLAGTGYVFLFILAREKYSLVNLAAKFVGIGLVGAGLYRLAI